MNALSEFLKEARTRPAPFNVFLAADVFQSERHRHREQIEKLAPLADYVCPMLYPSGFRLGIPGYPIPAAHPNEIVRLSLAQAAQRTGLPPTHFRPWLQAFRDYAFDKRQLGAREISAQIKAAEDFGADGWMLWNPRNVYPADIFPNIPQAAPPKTLSLGLTH